LTAAAGREVRVGIAMESLRPRLPVHADSGSLAARIAEASVEGQGTCLRIEIQDEEAVVAVFAGVRFPQQPQANATSYSP
jgi:hypothetical protein